MLRGEKKGKLACVRNHDLTLLGRNKWHQCIACNKEDTTSPRRREMEWAKQGILNESNEAFKVGDFNRHFQIQGGCCKICNRHQSDLKATLGVDHNHVTGIVRSLLCHRCNLRTNNLTIEEALKIVNYLKENDLASR